MIEIIGSLISGAGGWLAAALGVLLALVGVFFKGRSEGRNQERARQDRARIEAIEDRKNVEETVRQMGDDDVDREYDRWVRHDKSR